MNGVALFLNSKMSSSLIERFPISHRILIARFHHRHGNITILVVYAQTEAATENDKDSFYNQLEPLISAIPPHDQLLVLGDFNAVTGTDRSGNENVVGNYGSGTPNNNSQQILNMCSMTNTSVIGSFFRRLDCYRNTWISNDRRTVKEIDHMLTRYPPMFMSYRVFRGAEPPANSDHRLVVGSIRLQPYRRPPKPRQKKLNTEFLLKDDTLAVSYNVAVSNRFQE